MRAPEHVLKRHGELKSDRAPFETQWREIARLMVPECEDMFGTAGGKTDVSTEIYDATQLYALESFSGGLFADLTNPANRWFEASLDDPDLARWQPVKEWLYACETAIYASLSPNVSNFYSEVPAWFTDLGAFGMGVMYQEEAVGEGRIRDMAISLGEIYVDLDDVGQLHTVHREWRMKGARAMARFPGLAGATETGEYTIIHAVEKNETFDPERPLAGKPYTSTYVCQELRGFARQGGYWEMPYQVPMWKRRSGRKYPIGPGHLARADVAMLQEMERTHLVAAQYAAEPPLLVEDEAAMTAADVMPNAVLYGGMSPAGKPLAQALNRAQNLQLSMDQSRQRREAIREAFFFSIMQLMQRPQMTATEVLSFEGEKLRLMAPNLARIQSQGLSPFLTRRFRIMQRGGAFPLPPEELANRRVEFSYISPLAKLLKASLGKSVLTYASGLAQLGQMTGDMAVMDNLDSDAAAEILHDAYGPPPAVRRDPALRDKLRQARAEAAQQQVGLEQAGQAAQIEATVAHAQQAATLSEKRAA